MMPNLLTESAGPISVLDEMSPFLLHLLYKVASIYLRINHATPIGSATDKVNALKDALRLLNERWLVAG